MESYKALIRADGIQPHSRLDLLYYPAIKWMLRALSEAGIREACVISRPEVGLSQMDYSDLSISVTVTEDVDDMSAVLLHEAERLKSQGGDGIVLLFDAIMPALTPGGLRNMGEMYQNSPSHSMIVRSMFSGSSILCIHADALHLALLAAEDTTNVAISTAANAFRRSTSGLFSPDDFCPLEDMRSVVNLETILRERTAQALIDKGVYLQSIQSITISPEAEIAPGASVLSGSILSGKTRVGSGSVIGPNSVLSSAVIGENTTVNASQILESEVGDYVSVGPYAYIRPGSRVHDHVKVGDFVELKKAQIGEDTKIAHLTYIGDAEVGKRVNFGCGTVFVNYDGNNKYITRVEDDAFIGCNTNLVAPVTVGKGAYTAAGSTITTDVPEDALVIARSREVVKKDWAKKHRQQKKQK